MKMTRPSSVATLMRAGKAKTRAITRSRSPLRFLRRRNIRRTRATRKTRKAVGGTGKYCMRSSRKNCESKRRAYVSAGRGLKRQ